MRDFKFLTKNDITSYNGQMSREAIDYLYDYTNRMIRHDITTTIATYRWWIILMVMVILLQVR